MRKNALDILKEVSPLEIFEFGSVSSKKTKTLISKALKQKKYLTYFSFDISTKALKMSYDQLKQISKNLDVQLIQGDFNNDISNCNTIQVNSMMVF